MSHILTTAYMRVLFENTVDFPIRRSSLSRQTLVVIKKTTSDPLPTRERPVLNLQSGASARKPHEWREFGPQK